MQQKWTNRDTVFNYLESRSISALWIKKPRYNWFYVILLSLNV